MSCEEHTIQLEYNFLDIVVEGHYRKGEVAERDYPGSPSEFEIDKIRLIDNDQNLYLIFEKAEYLSDLKRLVIKIIEG